MCAVSYKPSVDRVDHSILPLIYIPHLSQNPPGKARRRQLLDKYLPRASKKRGVCMCVSSAKPNTTSKAHGIILILL